MDKRVDTDGAVVLRDSRLSEDTFMIFWREKKQTNATSVVINNASI